MPKSQQHPQPDPYKLPSAPLGRNVFTTFAALKDGVNRIGFPHKYKNIAGGTVGLGEIKTKEQFEDLEQQIQDVLERNSAGLKVIKVKESET